MTEAARIWLGGWLFKLAALIAPDDYCERLISAIRSEGECNE